MAMVAPLRSADSRRRSAGAALSSAAEQLIRKHRIVRNQLGNNAAPHKAWSALLPARDRRGRASACCETEDRRGGQAPPACESKSP